MCVLVFPGRDWMDGSISDDSVDGDLLSGSEALSWALSTHYPNLLGFEGKLCIGPNLLGSSGETMHINHLKSIVKAMTKRLRKDSSVSLRNHVKNTVWFSDAERSRGDQIVSTLTVDVCRTKLNSLVEVKTSTK